MEIPPVCCPTCDYAMDRATAVKGDGIPTPGAITVCIECAEFLCFTDTMGIRKLTGEELDQLRDETLASMWHARRFILGPRR